MNESTASGNTLPRRRAMALLATAPLTASLGLLAQSLPQPGGGANRPVIREPLVPFQQRGKFGYKDQNGVVVTPPTYNGAGGFVDYLGRPRQIAWIRLGERFGYVNRQGKVVIQPNFETIHEFSEGLAGFRVEGLYGYLDVNGGIAIPPRFKSIEPFSNGAAAVRLDDEIGWVDRVGVFHRQRPESRPQL